MNSGHLKDSTIQVLFDRDMDVNSIYFTDPEIDALQRSGVTEFLPSLSSGRGKQYGYIKEGKTYFKNIVLTNNKTGKNINDRFAAPFFDNPRTLSIPASKETGHMLDSYTQVLVSIEKEFFYSEAFGDPKPKPVTLSQSKKWMYQVNSVTDTQPLIIATSGENDVFTAELTDNTRLSAEASHTIAENGSGVETLKFMKDGKLNLNLQVLEQNNGSGPANFFKLHIKKLYGENYTSIAANQQTENSATIYYQNVTADEAVFNDTIILEDELKVEKKDFTLDDGLYSVYFEFRDRSNNPSYYPANDEKFYFAVDTKSPVMEDPVIRSSNSTTYTLEWNDYCDLKTTEIIYTEDGTEKPVVSIEKGTRNSDITNITAGKTYDVKVKFTDYAGNYVEKTIPKFLTGFTLTGTPSFTGTNASHADKVFFVGDKISYYGITAQKHYSDGSSVDITSDYSIPTRSSYNSSWTPGYSYSEANISKTASITSGTYYIAKKDSLTQKPVYSHTDQGWKMYKFGDYPQSVSIISSYTSGTVYNGWYLGSDGYFYEKCTAKIADNMGVLNGINNGTTYYFKVEPIQWRKLTDSYKGYSLLSAYMVLDQCVYYKNTSNRTISGSTVYPNNYKYSTLRAFLNGKYESGDSNNSSYYNNGFLQKAFTSSAQSKIKTVSVDNGGSDKVFVLSHSAEELENTNYGFPVALNQGTWRQRDITQYGAAKTLGCSGAGGYYWTRTYDTSGSVAIVYGNGYVVAWDDVTTVGFGILPALCVSSSDLQ